MHVDFAKMARVEAALGPAGISFAHAQGTDCWPLVRPLHVPHLSAPTGLYSLGYANCCAEHSVEPATFRDTLIWGLPACGDLAPHLRRTCREHKVDLYAFSRQEEGDVVFTFHDAYSADPVDIALAEQARAPMWLALEHARARQR